MALPLYLIGARGCGKTTVGQALAYEFRDTDHHLQQMMQRSVAEIVIAEGWEGFRQRESDALVAVTAPATVIATGGGMVLAERNRRYMREHGQVVYLNAGAGVLAARLAAYPQEAQRPTLTGRPVSEEMVEVLAARDGLYQQTAHHIIDATSAPEKVVRHVLDVLVAVRAS